MVKQRQAGHACQREGRSVAAPACSRPIASVPSAATSIRMLPSSEDAIGLFWSNDAIARAVATGSAISTPMQYTPIDREKKRCQRALFADHQRDQH